MLTSDLNYLNGCYSQSFPVTVHVALGEHGDEVWDPEIKSRGQRFHFKGDKCFCSWPDHIFSEFASGCIPDVHGETDVWDHFQLSK